MSMFADPTTATSERYDYFKPDNYANAKALIVEVEAINHNGVSPEGNTRKEADGTISVFANQRDVDSFTPSEVKKVRFTHTALAGDAIDWFEKEGNSPRPRLSIVKKVPFGKTGRSGFVFRPVTDPAVKAAAETYFENRGAVEADDEPPF